MMRCGSLVRMLVAGCVLVLANVSMISAKEYRIDSQADFDRLCNKKYKPGDQILFKRGETFNGMFKPRGSGAEGQPIVVDAYGVGDLPVIHAQGEHRAGVFLHNVEFWEVNRLEITNTNGSEEDQGELFGIYVLVDDGKEGVYQHIYINECFVHDVNAMVEGKKKGGIHVHMRELKKSKFHDVRITKNRVFQIGGVGIGTDSSCAHVDIVKPRKKQYTHENLWTKLYIADNFVDFTGRNSIIGRSSEGMIIERNIAANSSRRSVGHNIFNFDTVGAVIQFNEAYGNVGDGNMDRGGFDADFNNVDTYIQYNYSHDNLWFCGIMKKPNLNVTIRHNISQNDKEGIYFYGFERKGQARNIHIYNNTHYVGREYDVQVIAENRTPVDSRFEKNIFYFEGRGRWGSNILESNGAVFNDNVYFNIDPHPTDKNAKVGDPLFMGRRRALSDIDLTTMRGLSGYRLRRSSPFEGYGAILPSWLK